MKKNAGHTAKIALRDFLAKRYEKNIARLNAAWATDLRSFDEILQRNQLDEPNVETVRTDKAAFLALVAQRYFSCTTKAIRAIDPDHLILGCRFVQRFPSGVRGSGVKISLAATKNSRRHRQAETPAQRRVTRRIQDWSVIQAENSATSESASEGQNAFSRSRFGLVWLRPRTSLVPLACQCFILAAACSLDRQTRRVGPGGCRGIVQAVLRRNTGKPVAR
jgi:hypothetical protein